MKEHKIAAAVLVGGFSVRMGFPKHTAQTPDGRTFLDRICDEIDSVYKSVLSGRYISSRSDQSVRRNGYTVVHDMYEAIGPVGGIASVLMSAKQEGFDAVLVLACDLVGYDRDEIINICKRYRKEDVLFARTNKSDLQPLASIYSVTAIPACLSMIEDQDYRLRNIADHAGNIGYYDSIRKEAYVNCNTLDSCGAIHGKWRIT